MGLKPAGVDDDTIELTDLTLCGIHATLNRIEKLHEHTLAAVERQAVAAERQADALEVVAQLFASVTGVANQWCPGDERETSPVNYIRASASGGNFQCDKSGDDSDDD
jgi:hypothetical protein